MYCGKCGKRVHDDMLFCPFCGTPIVIPDQTEPVDPKPASQPEPKPAAVEEPPKTEFVPLRFSFEEAAEEAHDPEPPVPETSVPTPETPVSELPRTKAESPRMRSELPRTKAEPPRGRSANTYVPFRDVDPNNLFMYPSDEDEDDFDSDDFEPDDSFDYEEREEGGFLRRHVRGIVALILLVVALLVCAVWATSAGGQYALAKVNLAWTAEPYARLGYEAYNAQDYTLSAKNYSRAIALEETNYEYAHSAMVAEYMADRLDSATVMAKKCVELNPDSAEPYLELKKIYTNRDLPWDVRELLKQGYERTGDDQLNVE